MKQLKKAGGSDNLEGLKFFPIDRISLEDFSRWQNDTNLRSLTMGFRFPVQKEVIKDWLADVSRKNGINSAHFSVFFEDVAVGMCSANDINWVHRSCSIGLYLADQKIRGRGIGAATLSYIVNFCFWEINIHRIYLRVHSENISALNLYKGFGFTEEGVEKESYFLNGKYVDVIRMALICTDYNEKNRNGS